MRTKSKIYKISKDEMEDWLNNHSNMDDLFSFIGFRRAGGNFKTLQKYIKENDLIDTFEKFRKKVIEAGHKKTSEKNSLSYEEIFCQNSKAPRKTVKRFLIANKILEYKCSKCGNEGIWQDEKITLQLHHINGVYNDNRIENLTFLCPNCHSQTENYVGKTLKKNSFSEKKIEKKLEKERWDLLQNSDIDFTRFGWVKELSKLWNIANNKAGKYVKKHYPEFYKTCFVRN